MKDMETKVIWCGDAARLIFGSLPCSLLVNPVPRRPSPWLAVSSLVSISAPYSLHAEQSASCFARAPTCPAPDDTISSRCPHDLSRIMVLTLQFTILVIIRRVSGRCDRMLANLALWRRRICHAQVALGDSILSFIVYLAANRCQSMSLGAHRISFSKLDSGGTDHVVGLVSNETYIEHALFRYW